MKEKLISLIKNCRAESEKRWSPVRGFKNERERDDSNAYDRCADALEELVRHQESFMEETIEKLHQINRILAGEEGPELILDYAEDARYTYPKRISAALKVLVEAQDLLTSQSSGREYSCSCSAVKRIGIGKFCPDCGGRNSRR